MPPSAYFLYVQENRASLTGSSSEVAKQLALSWSTLSQDVKTGFENEAKKLKEQCDTDLAAFKKVRRPQKEGTAIWSDLLSRVLAQGNAETAS